MILATLKVGNEELAAIIVEGGAVSIREINKMIGKGWSEDVLTILQKNQLEKIKDWYRSGGLEELKSFSAFSEDSLSYAPLYRNPGKIWGVGMNYVEKAIELSGGAPKEKPVIFMKPNTSLIGHEDVIRLPSQSSQVTAEAELGIIIGKTCKCIKEERAKEVVAGFVTTLDITAKDIHARNPRFLQRSKSFDTFFSLGPHLYTTDECVELGGIEVETILNGEVHYRNVVANMMFRPLWIVSFFSQIMTLHPGDIIMTGTPGSVVIRDGDVAAGRISGFRELKNPVGKEM